MHRALKLAVPLRCTVSARVAKPGFSSFFEVLSWSRRAMGAVNRYDPSHCPPRGTPMGPRCTGAQGVEIGCAVAVHGQCQGGKTGCGQGCGFRAPVSSNSLGPHAVSGNIAATRRVLTRRVPHASVGGVWVRAAGERGGARPPADTGLSVVA